MQAKPLGKSVRRQVIHSFIHSRISSFNKYLWSACCMLEPYSTDTGPLLGRAMSTRISPDECTDVGGRTVQTPICLDS